MRRDIFYSVFLFGLVAVILSIGFYNKGYRDCRKEENQQPTIENLKGACSRYKHLWIRQKQETDVWLDSLNGRKITVTKYN